MSAYSNFLTTKYNIIPIVTKPYFILLHLPHCQMSHCSNFQTSTYIIFPIVTPPHITLFQLPHQHISHCSKYHTTIHLIFRIFTQQITLFLYHTTKFTLLHLSYDYVRNIALFPFSNDHISHYSNCHTNACQSIPITTQQHILFQLSHEHMSEFYNCHTTT